MQLGRRPFLAAAVDKDQKAERHFEVLRYIWSAWLKRLVVAVDRATLSAERLMRICVRYPNVGRKVAIRIEISGEDETLFTKVKVVGHSQRHVAVVGI